MNHPARPLHPPCSCTAVDLYPAFQAAAGDQRHGRSTPFPSQMLKPGEIDKRVILQTERWVDLGLGQHRIEDLAPQHCAEILAQLDVQSASWIVDSRVHYISWALGGTATAARTATRLELLDTLTPGWIHHTPLGHRLHELNHTEPAPIRIATPLGAGESDQPEVLRDSDRGFWRVTTESGSIYELDLDQRRIRRVPGHTADHNGNGNAPPGVRVTNLVYDRDWLGLEFLIHCVIGHPLVAFDERSGDGGYRLSTLITSIQRTPATSSGAPSHGR